jgi:hypothetical protein
LSRELGFDMIDLVANRKGQMSSAQHARFIAGARSVHLSSAIMQIVCMSFSAIACAYLLLGGLMQLLLLQELPRVAHLFPLAAGAAVGYWFKRYYDRGPPPVLPVALCAEGRVKWDFEEGSEWGADSSYVLLDAVRLSVAIKQQKALAEGLRYRVYYTTAHERIAGAKPHTILSAEPLDP